MVYFHFLVIFICITGAFIFAGSETGFMSWNQLKLIHKASQGDMSAKMALYLMNRKNTLLSAVLIGNNLCIIIATLSFLCLYSALDSVVPFDLHVIKSPESWFLTPFFVIFGEMLPKSLYRIYSFRLTIKSVPVLLAAYFIVSPATLLLGLLGKFFTKKVDASRSYMTRLREDMVLVATEGSRRGTIPEAANVLIANILKLKDRSIADVAPAPERTIRVSDTVAHIIDNSLFSDSESMPVFNDSGENIEGWLTILDLANAGRESVVKNIMNPVPSINDDISLLSCLGNKYFLKFPFCGLVDKSGRASGFIGRLHLFRLAFEGVGT